ncbi:MAG: glutamyl-tRNA reductase [Myxococcota bacterium]
MLVSLSLDHRRAGLAVRERFHLDDEAMLRAHRSFAAAGATSVVLAQTCNRLEAYAWWPGSDAMPRDAGPSDEERTRAALARAMCTAWCAGEEAEAEEMARFAAIGTGAGAVEHLLRVAAGLESQVLGDVHVLAQLRQAYRRSVELGRAGSPMHRLFEQAFRLGKAIRRETGLMSTRSGVGSEAARVAQVIEGPGSLVVVGCGKIGAQAAQTLVSRGARDVILVNRTVHRAEALARQLGLGRWAGLEELPEILAQARAVIVATDSREPVVTAGMVGLARAIGGGAVAWPLTLIDVSVPRNVDPEAAGVGGVRVIDLDSLHPESSAAVASRRAAIPQVEQRVAEACREVLAWLELNVARASLDPLRSVLVEACRREIAFVTGEDRSAARAADRIVARVLAHPMSSFRSASARGEDVSMPADLLGSLFR